MLADRARGTAVDKNNALKRDDTVRCMVDCIHSVDPPVGTVPDMVEYSYSLAEPVGTDLDTEDCSHSEEQPTGKVLQYNTFTVGVVATTVLFSAPSQNFFLFLRAKAATVFSASHPSQFCPSIRPSVG